MTHMKKLLRSALAALAIRPKRGGYWWAYHNI